jgi:integrase/recombinase XerD
MARAKQYADRVNVIKRIKLGTKWPFAPVVERNGRIVRDQVWVSGREEHHPEGRYYLEWYESGRRRRKPVPAFEDVLQAARSKSIELNARKAGILLEAPQAAPAPQAARLTLASAIDQYLEYVRAQRSLRTYRTYRPTLDVLLRNSYTKIYVDEATREDLLKFMSDCFRLGLGSRTVYDKLVVVLQLFKRNGKKGLLETGDWPKYVDAIRPIYEPEEIEAMLEHAEPEDAIFLKFLLASGFRDQEAQFVSWRDIDFRNCLARVTAKPLWEFNPKNYEERAVPLPEAMMEQLERLKIERHAVASQPVFPNTKGKPDSLLIDVVKRVAHRAKLNCGQCVTKHGNKCAKGPYCQNFFLHKFRHTFATNHLRDGVDIVTLQGWMGHRDIQSTMVYSKALQSKDALAKVNPGAIAAYIARERHGKKQGLRRAAAEIRVESRLTELPVQRMINGLSADSSRKGHYYREIGQGD